MTEIAYKNLFSIGKGQKMIIQGHRGGFSPDNSLEGFQCALDNNVQSVELDVSISMFLANFSLS